MKKDRTRRFWVETILAAASAACLVATLVWPQWIEELTGLEPDGGDGSAEWGWSLAFCAATVLCLIAARRSYKRIHSQA